MFRSGVPGSVVECRAGPDRVVQTHLSEAFGAHAKPPDSAAGGGDIPAFRRRVEARRAVGDAGLAAGIERDSGQAAWLLALRVAEIRAALHAVVKEAAITAVDSDPMDHAGLEIGHEELLVRLIISEITEGRTAVGAAIQADGGEHARAKSARSVELVNRSRPAGAPHASHPLPALRGTMQAEGGGGSEIDRRWRRIVQYDAEHLTHIASSYGLPLGFIDPMPPAGRLARRTHVEDAADNAGGIDRRGAVWSLRGAGETRDIGFAGAQRVLLRHGGPHWCEYGRKDRHDAEQQTEARNP